MKNNGDGFAVRFKIRRAQPDTLIIHHSFFIINHQKGAHLWHGYQTAFWTISG